MRVSLKGLSKTRIAAIIFLIGLLIGVLFANIFRQFYVNEMKLLDYSYNQILQNQSIDYTGLLKYTLIHNLKDFFIYWILCFTILGIPYIIVSIVYKGFEIGFLISAVTTLYGLKGILLFFSYILPQAFVYIPVILLCLKKGYELAQLSYYHSKSRIEMRKANMIRYLTIIFISLALLGIGCILETYFGSTLLKKTLELCL